MGQGADFFYLSTNCYLEISNLQIAHLANFQQIANPVIFDKWKMIRGSLRLTTIPWRSAIRWRCRYCWTFCSQFSNKLNYLNYEYDSGCLGLDRRRRRMEREAKAKVVASSLGAEFVHFFAALAVLPWSIWKKRSNSSNFSKSTKAKQLAQRGIEKILPQK